MNTKRLCSLLVFILLASATDAKVATHALSMQQPVLDISAVNSELQPNDSYLLVVKPGICPRCEPILYTLLYYPQIGENSRILLYARNQAIAERYAQVNDLDTSKIAIIDKSFFDQFQANAAGTLETPFLIKINTSTKEVLALVPVLGTSFDSLLLAELWGDSVPVTTNAFAYYDERRMKNKNHSFKFQYDGTLRENKTTKLDDKALTGSLLYFDIDKGKIILTDPVFEELQLRDLLHSQNTVVVKPTSEDYSYYSENKDLAEYYRVHHFSRAIYNIGFFRNNIACVAASLPKVWGTIQNSNYSNEHCIKCQSKTGPKYIQLVYLDSLQPLGFTSVQMFTAAPIEPSDNHNYAFSTLISKGFLVNGAASRDTL